MYTTLNQIESRKPCTQGWRTLLKALGKTKADDDPVSMAFILQSNGFEDAVWTFKCLAGADREIRLFAVDCARQVQHLMTDPRSLAALDVAERFANGLATSEELDAAWWEAYAAWRASAETMASGSAIATLVTNREAARAAAVVVRDTATVPIWVLGLAVSEAARAAAVSAWDAADVSGRAVCDSDRNAAWDVQAEIFLKYFG